MRCVVLVVSAIVMVTPGARLAGAAGPAQPAGKIAFIRTGGWADPDSGDLLVMNADGSGVTNLTQGLRLPIEQNLVWASDGSKIAFVSWGPPVRNASTRNIYVIGADGGAARALTSSDWSDSPVWSPDGRKIAFVRRSIGPSGNLVGPEVFVMNADGSRKRRLTRNRLEEFDLAWSRTGKLVFARRPDFVNTPAQIYSMSPDGSGLRQLTRNRFYHSGVAPSPDGRRIAYVRSTRDHRVSTVWVMHADGSGQRRLLAPLRQYLQDSTGAVWSPRGRKLALTWGPVEGHIYVMNANGSGLRRIVRSDPREAPTGTPTWSPDGRMLAFHRHPAIYRVNVDGTGRRRIAPPPGSPPLSHGENWSPVWAPKP